MKLDFTIASDVVMHTIPLDIRETEDVIKLCELYIHGMDILKVFKNWKNSGLISEEIWKNNTTILFSIINVDENQLENINSFLSNHIAGEQRLANKESNT